MNNNFIAQIQNLNLNFKGKKLFKNLNFNILENTSSALLGSSGVGKSTLLRCIADLETENITNGEIVLKKGGIISTIVDDFSIVSSFDSMVEALKVLVKKGKEVGYFINFDKTQYCMSPVYDKHISQTRIKILLDLGFSMDMIRIHPDSVSLNDEPVDVEKREEEYGVKLLGAFIGSSTYIH